MKTCIRAPVIEADDFASLSRMSNFNQFQTDRCRKLNVQCDASVTLYTVSSEAKTAVSPCFFMHFFTVSMAIFNRLSRARNWRSDSSGATGSSFVALRNRSLRGVFCLLIDWKRFHVDWRILKKKNIYIPFSGLQWVYYRSKGSSRLALACASDFLEADLLGLGEYAVWSWEYAVWS